MCKNIKYVAAVCIVAVLLGFKSRMDKVYIKADKQNSLQVTIGKEQYKAALQTDSSLLNVIKIPEDEKLLRIKSAPIPKSDYQKVLTFMKQYLLPTMYESGGVGIAAIQVGLPIRAFIVDIPDTKVLHKDYEKNSNVRAFLNTMLATGATIIVKETYVAYSNGHMAERVKFRKTTPVLKEINGQQQVVDMIKEDIAVDDESIIDVVIERKPHFVLNPELELDEQGEKIVLPEGCLSVPLEVVQQQYTQNTSDVNRPRNVRIKYVDGDMHEKI